MSNENKQNDERAAFEGVRNLLEHAQSFTNCPRNVAEKISLALEKLEVIENARATQQATTGDERAMFEADVAFVADHTLARLNKKGCPGEWVDYAYEQIIAAGYIRQQAKSRATTPSPVAGSAGQALLSDDALMAAITSVCAFGAEQAEKWRPEALAIGRAVERALRANSAAPTAPSLTQGSAGQAPVSRVEHETAIEALRHVIDCLRKTGSYTDEEGEATDFLEPLLHCAPTAPSLATDAEAVDQRHVGDSNFEGWYQEYATRLTGNPKQTARDAYAAGMGDTTEQTLKTPPDPSDIQGWAVTVNVNTVDILTIGHNSLSGIDNIGDFAEVVRNCAKHLTAFIGDGGTEQRMSEAARGESHEQ